MARNLILTGGIRHDFEDNTEAVMDLLNQVDLVSEFTTDIDGGIKLLENESFDLVTVMALRWPMEGNPKYAPLRAQYGYSMSEQSRTMLTNFVKRGGGLFGLHTACLCFDDWDGWQDILGGAWNWGHSYHPPVGLVTVTPTNNQHAITSNIGKFSLTDEVYSNLNLANDVVPLITASATPGSEEPVLWARHVEQGRVVFDALGHNRQSLDHETHSRLIQRCAAWASGFSDQAITSL